MNKTPMDSEAVRETIRQGYAEIANGTSAGFCGPGASSCGSSPQDSEKLAKELGYAVDELLALPEGANMGLSCGNPAALATLKPGEVVLDLGSGGGFDVFIAGRKVGATGWAIGVDKTPEMLAKARRSVANYRQQTGPDNVEFRLGEIEHLPIADNSVDVVISNCVINLSPDKQQVWAEIARILKPGGRVAVSDIALLKPLPAEVSKLVEALVGCVARAVLVGETETMAKNAGLQNVVLKSKPSYIEAMTSWEDPLYRKIIEHLPPARSHLNISPALKFRRRSPESIAARLEAMFAGPICGASMNPARSLAPAAISGHLEHLWIYLAAPVLGAATATLVCRCVRESGCCAELKPENTP